MKTGNKINRIIRTETEIIDLKELKLKSELAVVLGY